MQRAANSIVSQPFKTIEAVNSPMTYSNSSFATEQIMIEAGGGIEIDVTDGHGGVVQLTNTRCFLLNPFCAATIRYVVAPTAIKAMVL